MLAAVKQAAFQNKLDVAKGGFDFDLDVDIEGPIDLDVWFDLDVDFDEIKDNIQERIWDW